MEQWQWEKLKRNCERAKQLPDEPLEMPPRPDQYDQLDDRGKMIVNQMRFVKAVKQRQKARLDSNGDIILNGNGEK